jgi:hypothetical protein
MIKYYSAICLAVISFLLLSFSKSNQDNIPNSEIAGFWVTGNPADPNAPSHMKVFEENGSYYNVGFEKGNIIMTHKGEYKVLDEGHYKEKVTHLRFNAKWDLKNKEFINSYELSKDKKWLVLSGVVFSKDGKDSLKWSHSYRKVEVPE